MNLENGKTYEVTHSRKGHFTLRVESQSEDWITGLIVDGTASGMMDYNDKEAGEEITVMKSFLSNANEITLPSK